MRARASSPASTSSRASTRWRASRRDPRGHSTADDAAALASITAVIADGIRTSIRFDAARQTGDGSAPGLVVLGPSNDVELITPPAHELLAAMRSTAPATAPRPGLPLAGFTRSRSHDPDRQPDTVAVPTPSGWITLHASLPERGADKR